MSVKSHVEIALPIYVKKRDPPPLPPVLGSLQPVSAHMSLGNSLLHRIHFAVNLNCPLPGVCILKSSRAGLPPSAMEERGGEQSSEIVNSLVLKSVSNETK